MEDVQYILEEGQFIPESFAGRSLQLQENNLDDVSWIFFLLVETIELRLFFQLACEEVNSQTVLVKNGQYFIPGQGVFEGHVSLGQLIISSESWSFFLRVCWFGFCKLLLQITTMKRMITLFITCRQTRTGSRYCTR